MTRPGGHPAPNEARALIARLMQIHRATHPMILARTFNFTPRYVRKLYEQIEHQDMQTAMRWLGAAFTGEAMLQAALANKEHSRVRAVPDSAGNGETDRSQASGDPLQRLCGT